MRRAIAVGLAVVAAAVLAAGCPGQHREARTTYNEGVAAIERGELDAAAKALLDARSRAGVDPELRFRAAYDLGIVYAAMAGKAQTGDDADLAKALDLAQQAASWFGDAARQRPDDADAKANLAIMRVRVQALADELRRGEGKLEARIDAAIRDQRGVLDGIRAAWLEVKRAGGADPLAQQAALTALADRERIIVAEVGAISDVAADEIDAIGKKPDDQRDDQEKVRVVQLKNVDLYLLESRGRIADARRKLQELAADDALAKAEAALAALKRAREQLLDPIAVLRGIAQDEVALLQDTLRRERDTSDEPEPAWLAPAALAERQGSYADRLAEVRARLEAGAASEPPADQQAHQPDQAKLLARVKVALPFVAAGGEAMAQARQALAEGRTKPAVEHERAALVALARAIEEFADLKQTIELAHGEQEQLLALLSPEAQAQLPAQERAAETRAGLARNVERVRRLEGLIADEVTKLAEEEQKLAAQPPAQPPQGGAAPAPDAGEAAKQQLEAAKQRLELAESLRAQALAALGDLEKALAGQDPTPPARTAKERIEELRKLFFSVIEHLQQLLRDQAETRDQTSAATADDDLTRAPKLPGLLARQEQHAGMAKAITEALAQQADAAAKAPAQAAQGGPDAKSLSAAADEVRLAQGALADTKVALEKVRDAKASSESLAPAIAAQTTTLEHLENALRLLQPPPKQGGDKDPQQQDPQQQDQPQKPQDPQRQQSDAGQRAREQDAEQQRKRREQEAGTEPVEKDW